jgi:Ca-activated chloride channel family protein
VSFTWPLALFFGLSVPLVLGAYLLALRRRRRQAVAYSSLALLRTAVPRRSRWTRHLSLALLVASLALLTLASARPQITSEVPLGGTSIILALDESGSMCSTDVKPNRLGAAQMAAHDFVDAEPAGVRIGVVLFSGFAELAVPPTSEHDTLNQAIDNLSAGGGTAIGAAILKSLDAIAQVDPRVQPVGNAQTNADTGPAAASGQGGSGGTAGGGSAAQRPGVGGYVPDVIVLLTDGSNTQGISPQSAVPYAVARRVRIFTIGLGTSQPAPLICSPGQHGGNSGFGFAYGGGAGPGIGGGPSPLVADLPTLQEVSQRTGGASFKAQDASGLNKVFATLPRHIVVQKERHEVTVVFAAVGALLALAAFAASIRWSAYP